MSVYLDKMNDLLKANTAAAIQQLENDSATGNLEATYFLAKYILMESMLLLMLIDLSRFGKKGPQPITIASVL